MLLSASRILQPFIRSVYIGNAQTRVAYGYGVVSVQVTGGPWNAMDWVGLAPVGSGNTTYVTYKYVGTSGNPLTFTMPSTTGNHEFRLFANNGYTRLATSSTVTTQ